MSTAPSAAAEADLPDAWKPQADDKGRITDPDGPRTYIYPPTGELLTSVTTINDATTNEATWLVPWAARITAEAIIDDLETYARIKVLKGRDAAVDHAKGESERRRDVRRDVGTYVHDVQEALLLWAASPEGRGSDIPLPDLPAHLESSFYDMGDDLFVPVPEVADQMVAGFFNFVSDFSPVFLAAEMPAYNYPHKVAGTIDAILELHGYGISEDGRRAVARRGGILTPVVDTKTGKNPKGKWKEQLAAYRRMSECRPTLLDNLLSMPPTTCGAVLHLRPWYPGGYALMLVSGGEEEAAWADFKRSAETYRSRKLVKDKPGKVIRPLRPDGTMPGPRLCDLFSEGHGRALAPLVKHFGNATELELIAEMTLGELRQIKGIGPKLAADVEVMLAENGMNLADLGARVVYDALAGQGVA